MLLWGKSLNVLFTVSSSKSLVFPKASFVWFVLILICSSAIVIVKIKTENARFVSGCSFQLAIPDTRIKCLTAGGFLSNIIEYDSDNVLSCSPLGNTYVINCWWQGLAEGQDQPVRLTGSLDITLLWLLCKFQSANGRREITLRFGRFFPAIFCQDARRCNCL